MPLHFAFRVLEGVALTLSTFWPTATKPKGLGYCRLYHRVDACFRYHVQLILILKRSFIVKYSMICEAFW